MAESPITAPVTVEAPASHVGLKQTGQKGRGNRTRRENSRSQRDHKKEEARDRGKEGISHEKGMEDKTRKSGTGPHIEKEKPDNIKQGEKPPAIKDDSAGGNQTNDSGKKGSKKKEKSEARKNSDSADGIKEGKSAGALEDVKGKREQEKNQAPLNVREKGAPPEDKEVIDQKMEEGEQEGEQGVHQAGIVRTSDEDSEHMADKDGAEPLQTDENGIQGEETGVGDRKPESLEEMEMSGEVECSSSQEERDKKTQAELWGQNAYEQIKRRAAAHVLGRRFADRIYSEWETQAKELHATYQDFDLAKACKNPKFLTYLRAGVSLKDAYEGANVEKIKKFAEIKSAKKAIAFVMETIKTTGLRPGENGLNAPNALTIGSNITSLSKKEREEIAKRAGKGEKVTL